MFITSSLERPSIAARYYLVLTSSFSFQLKELRDAHVLAVQRGLDVPSKRVAANIDLAQQEFEGNSISLPLFGKSCS